MENHLIGKCVNVSMNIKNQCVQGQVLWHYFKHVIRRGKNNLYSLKEQEHTLRTFQLLVLFFLVDKFKVHEAFSLVFN